MASILERSGRPDSRAQPHTLATHPTEPAGGASGTHEAPTARHVLKIAPTCFFADYGCHVRILEETLALQALGSRVTYTDANGLYSFYGLPAGTYPSVKASACTTGSTAGVCTGTSK